jgi:outer membrane protein with beta-barrel domain
LPRDAYATVADGRCRGRPFGRAALATFVAIVVGFTTTRSHCAPPLRVPESNPYLNGAPIAQTFDPAQQPPVMPPSQTWPDGQPVAPVEAEAAPPGWFGPPPEMSPDQYFNPNWSGAPDCSPDTYLPIFDWLQLRHSYTFGRNVGVGGPYVGTSWLNRPYYFGGELGWIWITRAQEDSVTRDVDIFGGIFIGWDWDYYWGSELRFGRATPELVNAESLDARRNDVLFTWNYNAMYYPWGDAMLRPYWRWGIGNTKFDFPLDDGTRHDEWLFTFPIGLGFKYPFRPWLAGRAELTDYLSIGHNGLPTQNNLTLTFGLEWRFGIHPKSYWPWYPSRHQW